MNNLKFTAQQCHLLTSAVILHHAAGFNVQHGKGVWTNALPFQHLICDGHLKQWYRVIQKDGLNWTVNGTSTHARRMQYSKFSAHSVGWVDLHGLRSKLSWMCLMFSSDTHKKSCAA